MNIRIPSPCSESWDAMLPAEKGKHCIACNKVVVDFTSMSPEQIKAHFNNLCGEKICGRFLSGNPKGPKRFPLGKRQKTKKVS